MNKSRLRHTLPSDGLCVLLLPSSPVALSGQDTRLPSRMCTLVYSANEGGDTLARAYMDADLKGRLTGIELLIELKARQSRVPVLMISAYADLDVEKAVLKLGGSRSFEEAVPRREVNPSHAYGRRSLIYRKQHHGCESLEPDTGSDPHGRRNRGSDSHDLGTLSSHRGRDQLRQAMAIRADFTERHARSRGADGEGYF